MTRNEWIAGGIEIAQLDRATGTVADFESVLNFYMPQDDPRRFDAFKWLRQGYDYEQQRYAAEARDGDGS